MNGSIRLPSLEDLKKQASRLRTDLATDGRTISHSRALEMLAHQHGYKDWNTLRGVIGNSSPPSPVTLGQRVCGRYLGQAFEGDVTGVQMLNMPGRFRVTLQFDEPVDVVTFESFSNLRRRISCVINADGATMEKTSNGQPHLQLRA